MRFPFKNRLWKGLTVDSEANRGTKSNSLLPFTWFRFAIVQPTASHGPLKGLVRLVGLVGAVWNAALEASSSLYTDLVALQTPRATHHSSQ